MPLYAEVWPEVTTVGGLVSLCVPWVFVQICDQAAGGFGVLCGGHPQQRARCAGDNGKQAEPRTSETHAGTEHPQAGRAIIYHDFFSRIMFIFTQQDADTHTHTPYHAGMCLLMLFFLFPCCRSLSSCRLRLQTVVMGPCSDWRSLEIRDTHLLDTSAGCVTECSAIPSRTTGRTRWVSTRVFTYRRLGFKYTSGVPEVLGDIVCDKHLHLQPHSEWLTEGLNQSIYPWSQCRSLINVASGQLQFWICRLALTLLSVATGSQWMKCSRVETELPYLLWINILQRNFSHIWLSRLSSNSSYTGFKGKPSNLVIYLASTRV